MNIVFIIYIIGVIFNLIVIKKIIITSTDECEGFMAAFIAEIILLPWIFLMYFLRVIFIAGSWLSWIFLGIIKILEHYESGFYGISITYEGKVIKKIEK